MDTNLLDGQNTIFSVYGNLADEPHTEIVNLVEKEIQNFFATEINRAPHPNIILIEGKGLNLFIPYIRNILGLQGVFSMKIHGASPLSRESPGMYRLAVYSPPLNPTDDYIILTDALASGAEIKKVMGISTHILSKRKITRVCGYLANESALKEMKKIYPSIDFNFLKPVETEEEYERYQRNLKLVYQSRMDSTDGEHPNWLLNIEQDLDLAAVKKLVTAPFVKKGCDFYIKDNPVLIKDKYYFTVYFTDIGDTLAKCCGDININHDKIIKLAFRFKYSKSAAILRLVAIATPTLCEESKMDSLVRLITGSCRRDIPEKFCNMLSFVPRRLKGARNITCPHCIESNVSACIGKSFLSNFDDKK